MEERLSVEITQPLYGMAFTGPSEYSMQISNQHVYGIAFTKKMMVPEVGDLGIEAGAVGYSEDDYGFIDKRMV